MDYCKGKGHWRLNYLVYAGAELVSKKVKRTFAVQPKKQEGLKRKETNVQQRSRMSSWLETEI